MEQFTEVLRAITKKLVELSDRVAQLEADRNKDELGEKAITTELNALLSSLDSGRSNGAGSGP